jgi:hypothetical protein
MQSLSPTPLNRLDSHYLLAILFKATLLTHTSDNANGTGKAMYTHIRAIRMVFHPCSYPLDTGRRLTLQAFHSLLTLPVVIT